MLHDAILEFQNEPFRIRSIHGTHQVLQLLLVHIVHPALELETCQLRIETKYRLLWLDADSTIMPPFQLPFSSLLLR